MLEESFGLSNCSFKEPLTRLMKKDFWAKMHADLDTISMCICRLEQVPISVERSQL